MPHHIISVSRMILSACLVHTTAGLTNSCFVGKLSVPPSLFPYQGLQQISPQSPFCKMHATSYKMPFVQSVGGIRLLCNVKVEGPFCEISAKAPNLRETLREICTNLQHLIHEENAMRVDLNINNSVSCLSINS